MSVSCHSVTVNTKTKVWTYDVKGPEAKAIKLVTNPNPNPNPNNHAVNNLEP